jgi:hypothetical protein
MVEGERLIEHHLPDDNSDTSIGNRPLQGLAHIRFEAALSIERIPCARLEVEHACPPKRNEQIGHGCR